MPVQGPDEDVLYMQCFDLNCPNGRPGTAPEDRADAADDLPRKKPTRPAART